MSAGRRRGGVDWPGFAVWELGPGAGAGPGRTPPTSGPVYPGADAQTKERKGVPQALQARGYSPERFPTPRSASGPTQASAAPGGAGRWPQRATPQPAHLLFSGWGGDHRAGSQGCGPRWGGGQTGPGQPSGPAGTLLLPPQRQQTSAAGRKTCPAAGCRNFLNPAGFTPPGQPRPRRLRSQSAPGPPFFKPSAGRQSGSSSTFLSLTGSNGSGS